MPLRQTASPAISLAYHGGDKACRNRRKLLEPRHVRHGRPPSPALPIPRPASAYARASLAPATLRAYQAGWQAFSEWCQLAGRTALPATPETVADHLASLATTLGRASLAKRLAVIGQ